VGLCCAIVGETRRDGCSREPGDNRNPGAGKRERRKLRSMGMTVSFLILAMMTLAGGVAAMTLRRLVHCALALAVAFAGLAALYLNLGAEFAGLAQLLVYVGAIAILIVFAILLTRGGEAELHERFSPAGVAGAVLALAVFGVLAWAVMGSGVVRLSAAGSGPAPAISMREIGLALMQRYVLPLEVIALMLTAAMIGATILAVRETSAAGGEAGAPRRSEPGSELRA
jgi:NADH:ubiquinone oxidoreductase subunit 6 (subunit J)